MEANELMIGDLVYIYILPNENPKQEDLMVAKLVGVNSDEIDENPIPFCEGRILSTNGIFSRPIATLMPIPLTDEMLNSNGFHEWIDDDKDVFRCSTPEGYIYNIELSPYYKGGYDFEGIGQILYVHQLQNILHIMGLHDLADNFKI